jgi:hypothetical protein
VAEANDRELIEELKGDMRDLISETQILFPNKLLLNEGRFPLLPPNFRVSKSF